MLTEKAVPNETLKLLSHNRPSRHDCSMQPSEEKINTNWFKKLQIKTAFNITRKSSLFFIAGSLRERSISYFLTLFSPRLAVENSS